MSENKDAAAQAVRNALMPIAEEMAEVERVITDELRSAVAGVDDIAHYITGAGGKRMRPALLILMARAMGASGKDSAYLGAVVEILHTATLMHDDVVDEGKMRRGRETVNSRWGNGQAVLVGDFLYTRSFQMMIRMGNLGVLKALADAANVLSEGEVMQMGNTHNPEITESRYFAVIERKTSCLFEGAARMAAALANAVPELEKACVDYAHHLGNAFQITDDILDYQGEAGATGKNLGADLREGKMTLPLIYALEMCSESDQKIIRDAVSSGDGDFAAISRLVVNSGALDRCRQRAMIEAEMGKDAILRLGAGQFTESLVKFIFFAVRRDH